MKYIFRLIPVCCLLLLMSCSNSDYVNVVPRESVAMAAVDMGDGEWAMGLENSGVDLSSKMYAFETPDGTLGLVAKVDDSDAVTDMFVKLSGEGKCSKPEERRGARFVMVKDSWLAGYNDDAIAVIGPISLMERTSTEQKMLKMGQRTRAFSRLLTPLMLLWPLWRKPRPCPNRLSCRSPSERPKRLMLRR